MDSPRSHGGDEDTDVVPRHPHMYILECITPTEFANVLGPDTFRRTEKELNRAQLTTRTLSRHLRDSDAEAPRSSVRSGSEPDDSVIDAYSLDNSGVLGGPPIRFSYLRRRCPADCMMASPVRFAFASLSSHIDRNA